MSCGVTITIASMPGSAMSPSAPGTAFSKPCLSATRRADSPLAEANATKRSNPAERKAGSNVLVENAPAPAQPSRGRRHRRGIPEPDAAICRPEPCSAPMVAVSG